MELSKLVQSTIIQESELGQAEDNLRMVTLLANARLKARPDLSEQDAELYAATMLCFFFDPVKTQRSDLVAQLQNMRSLYNGISKSRVTEQAFTASLATTLLRADTAGEALNQSFGELFTIQQHLKGV